MIKRSEPQNSSPRKGTGTVLARVTLYPHDVIGYRINADKSVTPILLGDEACAVLPTFVVHAPSKLNPLFLDAAVAFAPNTMSWLYRPHGSPRPRWAERPRVFVPLHPAGKRLLHLWTFTDATNANYDRAVVRYRST